MIFIFVKFNWYCQILATLIDSEKNDKFIFYSLLSSNKIEY